MGRQKRDAFDEPPNVDALDSRAKVVWYLTMRLKQKDAQIQEMLEREDELYESLDGLIDYARKLEHQVANLVRQKWAGKSVKEEEEELISSQLRLPTFGEDAFVERDPKTGAMVEAKGGKNRVEAGPIGEARVLIQARGTGKLGESELDVIDAEVTLAVMRYMGRMKVEKDVEPVLSDQDIDKFFKGIDGKMDVNRK